MANSSKRTYAICCISQICCSQSPRPCGVTCRPVPPQETLRHSKAGLAQSPVGVCDPFIWSSYTQGSVCALWVSLEGLRFNCKCNCAPPTTSPGLLLCPWMQGIFFSMGSNLLLLMVVQQVVAILVFSQEKMSACPSILPSLRTNLSEDYSWKIASQRSDLRSLQGHPETIGRTQDSRENFSPWHHSYRKSYKQPNS